MVLHIKKWYRNLFSNWQKLNLLLSYLYCYLLIEKKNPTFWFRDCDAVDAISAGWSRGCRAHLTLCCCWNGEFLLFSSFPYSSVFHCTLSLMNLPIPTLSFFRSLLSPCNLLTWQKDSQGWSSTRYTEELGARSRWSRDGTSLFSDGELRHWLLHWQTHLSPCWRRWLWALLDI